MINKNLDIHNLKTVGNIETPVLSMGTLATQTQEPTCFSLGHIPNCC